MLASSAVMARELSTEELERWFESDDLLPPSELAINVNEGNLVFLDHKPDKPVHHHTNHLIISKHSLETGWVWLKQCHENLDQVPRAQIMFRRGRVRDLQIITNNNIAESWVENNSVQLRDVRPGARLCVTAWT
ncbi:MAG: alpha/beta hydrolase, partial [Thiohalophilus sp.]